MEASSRSPPAVMVTTDMVETGLATPPVAPQITHDGTAVYIPGNNAASLLPSLTFTPYNAPEVFPVFHTGNVVIECNLVTPPMRWQLHGTVLARHSSWFRNAMQPGSRRSGRSHDWAFFLLEEHNGQLQLVLQEAVPKGQSLGSGSQILAIKLEGDVETTQSVTIPTPPYCETTCASTTPYTLTTHQPHAAIVDMYNQVLGSLYSIPVTIPTTTICETLNKVESLVTIAAGLQCIPLIAPSCTSALLSHHRELYTSIARDPARYLQLSLLLKSSCLYKDSLTHIIGCHPTWPWPTPRSVLPPHIIDLVVRKSEELERICVETERELLLLTIEIHRNGPVEPENHGQFDTWFVVQLFRDTLARRFHALEMSKERTLLRGEVIRQIAKGGDAYMPLEVMRGLVARVMPSALQGLEEDLGLLKACAKGIVADMVRNETGVGGEEVGWLTCVKIDSADVPWDKKSEASGF
jgi:hypothetical protein